MTDHIVADLGGGGGGGVGHLDVTGSLGLSLGHPGTLLGACPRLLGGPLELLYINQVRMGVSYGIKVVQGKGFENRGPGGVIGIVQVCKHKC